MTAIPNIVTIVGNLTADPELKSLQDGTSVVNLTIASTPSRFDRESNSYKDGEAVFYRGSAWRRDAENVAASLHKGNRVIAVAEAKPNSYVTKGGDNVTTIEWEIKEIAASLAFATVAITANPKGQGSHNTPTRSDALQAQATAPAAPAAAAPAAAPAAPVAAPAAVSTVADDDDFS